jgi:hypothetical protein
MPHAIFTSHSSGQNPLLRGKVLEFVKELNALVQSKCGRSAGECRFFFDEEEIRIGSQWRTELATAVRTSEVMICLISPLYLESEWCGQELTVFVRRTEDWARRPNRRLSSPSFVVPIMWELPNTRPLPAFLADLQTKQGVASGEYPRTGLRQILDRGISLEKAHILETLSDRIAEVLNLPAELPTHPEIGDWSQVPNALEVQIPFDLRWSSVVAPGATWPEDLVPVPLSLAVKAIAGELGCGSRRLSKGAALPTAVAKAQQDRMVIALAIEASQGAGSADLQALDAMNSIPFAVVVVDSHAAPGSPRLSAQEWVKREFPTSGSFHAALGEGRLASARLSDVRIVFQEVITEARKRIQGAVAPARVEDSRISGLARSNGLPIDQKPTLQGPGGTIR